MREIKRIIVHCADTYASMDVGVKEIRKWHVEERGWRDVGYHFVIRRDGSVEKGRDVSEVGAHCYGKNKRSIGICLVGGKADDGSPVDNFTKDQFISLQRLILDLKYKFEGVSVHGHYEFDDRKTCPNFVLKGY